MDTVVQQNASASEELASMSEELNSQAMAMTEAVRYFKIGEEKITKREDLESDVQFSPEVNYEEF